MKANVGGIDKGFRIILGLVLLGLAGAGVGLPWTWIGIVPLATGLINFCPLYAVFGMSTRDKTSA